MVRRGWLIVGEPLLAIRRFSTGGPTETYRRRPMTLVGHWWADSDKPTATCRPLPPLAHQSNAIWVPDKTALAVADAFFQDIVCRFGFPKPEEAIRGAPEALRVKKTMYMLVSMPHLRRCSPRPGAGVSRYHLRPLHVTVVSSIVISTKTLKLNLYFSIFFRTCVYFV